MKRVMISLTAGLLILFAGGVMAASGVPTAMNYQGLLTDNVGDPVPDASYSILFSIYDIPVGSGALWSETQNVTTADGLFSVILGTVSPITNAEFNSIPRYLGIKVGADPELTPRTELVTVPYAFNADLFDGRLPSYYDGIHVMKTGDVMTGGLTTPGISLGDPGFTGWLEIYLNGSASPVLSSVMWLQGSYLVQRDELGNPTTEFFSNGWGEGGFMYMYNSPGVIGIEIGGNAFGNGEGYLAVNGTSENVIMDMFQTSDASVQLPDSAISSGEILDEPGIAAQIGASVSHTVSGTMSDCATVTITIPAAGYIYVTGRGYCRTIHHASGGGVFGTFQIDETSGGGNSSPHYVAAGTFNCGSSTTDTDSDPFFCDRTYFKAAGTYTFRLEGMKASTNGTVNSYLHKIAAMYFPTAYGTVAAVSSSPGDLTGAEAITLTNLDGSKTTAYKYDLRELEIRAKDAKIKALEAQKALDAARTAGGLERGDISEAKK